MNFLSRRMWLLAGTAALVVGGAIGVACSPSGGGNDGGPDTGTTDAKPDTKPPGDSGPGPDGGPGPDAAPTTCEAGVTGACDIITQNCGSGKDCAVIQTDAGYVTQCVQNTTGTIPEGTACTVTGNNNSCVAGLECIQGRCAKHCCLGDDSACGSSKPEGFAGRCDLTVTVDGTNPAYTVCTYSPSCEPFKQQPCAGNQQCIVKDSNGTASCTAPSGADAGEGVGCQYANDCSKDGMGCYGAPDGGGFTCQWNCYVPPGPFDAGIATQGAGSGGCPTGETCKSINWSGALPTWFGLCGK